MANAFLNVYYIIYTVLTRATLNFIMVFVIDSNYSNQLKLYVKEEKLLIVGIYNILNKKFVHIYKTIYEIYT